MVAHLTRTGRHRILKTLEPRPVAASIRPEFPLKAVILDMELAGLNHRKDEIGAIAFTFHERGELDNITGVHGRLQQPTVSISAEITRLCIFAESSPFDLKDHLKAWGYRWSNGSQGRPRSWGIEVDEFALAEELHWPRTDISCYPEADPPTRYLTAFDRFRG